MKKTVLYASIIVAGGILLTNIYTSTVDAVSWGSNIPASLEIARQYFASSNPGNFFRIFSPLTQVLALLSLILFWKRDKQVRIFLFAALLLYVFAESLTFSYFYPRNDIMFSTTALTETETLKKAWQEWTSMNYFRSLLVLAGVIFSCLALNKIYLLQTRNKI